ncbi:hypothetical protein [Janthinobacterium sp. B9-8]|uniref:hypothetical protein n=1 Tax=Janthinobacterium sp. B9-8 TaxID=1236179 RepID=UPI00061D2285|nr:hypothetical protein [Janthinobacterium sp. B9-8]AMC33820.1 hypothetical protein VN23_04005 [Janthinobacterium sp. B9-8]
MNLRQIFLFIFSAFIFIISGCKAPSPEPKPPLSTPIKLDKTGQKVTIDFWSTPEDSHEKNILMLGVEFAGKDTNFDTDILRKTTPIVKIKVKRLDGASVDEGVHFECFSMDPNAPSLDKIKVANGSSEVTAYGYLFANNNYYLASIDRKTPGFFRAEVEVLKDNPKFNNLNFNIFVAYRLYGGK